ncbi:uncharacterized protein [Neodiprion pinetum]|uniref:Uncharacterized protein LOC107225116 n=1 Tax=Neodiprion lecontei TaxID=441921 RepID=A0ABM3GAU6_NEOLC|nr:uncharacterized protein LOC124220403 [Neodiprion pinetum]XP_046485183.1 uncharacterized protein LOC124220403 [Neodiprion pinetum]XP_046485185.1 uncharacterized protein LOC124220403 [Neodiprion pinetum]XP_046485186.1 uncharacterized protein LOC124220403 [Neodiprion pinetum]XP_046597392.1 uncharacterized protein LOC107225116 [Neodiprion lecontei]XP_046597393.1 uncharacterized protein LOC107225116 [Neodiprion lecontei]XP_046597394.1 uncharacterized protein LOC107225116 [Neodiprion lecontei]X
MTDEEVDEELVELRKVKEKLIERTIDLRNELDAWEKAGGKTHNKTEKDFLPEENQFEDLFNKHDPGNHLNKKCVTVSSFVLGFKFNDVDKKWISDHKYLYTAKVKSKVLEFFMEITVNSQDSDKNLEILEVECRFETVKKCYLLEIAPWIQRFTEAKDTSNLFGAVSDYTEQNIVRAKILNQLKNRDVVSVEEFIDDDGGIMILLHSKNNTDLIYLEVRWILRFLESMWCIDNFFIISQISAGDDFLTTHSQLLKNFCKNKINQTELEDLWNKLCNVVEQDETPSETGSSEIPI